MQASSLAMTTQAGGGGVLGRVAGDRGGGDQIRTLLMRATPHTEMRPGRDSEKRVGGVDRCTMPTVVIDLYFIIAVSRN